MSLFIMTSPLGVGQYIRVESIKKLGKLTVFGSCPEILGRDNARQAGLFSWIFQHAPMRTGQLFLQAEDRWETARKKWVQAGKRLSCDCLVPERAGTTSGPRCLLSKGGCSEDGRQ